MGTRVYLCGPLAFAVDDLTIDQRALPGRQGRLAFALLCIERRRPVSVDRVVQLLWDEVPPPDPAGSLASIVSKLRAVMRRAGAGGPEVISATSGAYQLRLPADATVDVEDARNAIDQAEGARRRGDVEMAWVTATVATAIARCGFLVGETSPWASTIQRELERTGQRGFDTLAWVWTARGDGVLATAMAEEAVLVTPLHEPAWRTLMATYARFGSRADAVGAYYRCRRVLRQQLGIGPDAETTRLYTQFITS